MPSMTVSTNVSELTDDRFSATFGRGRGTNGESSYEQETTQDPNAGTPVFSVDLPQGGSTYVVVFPDGLFLKKDESRGMAYPNSFANCSYFGTVRDAEYALDTMQLFGGTAPNGVDLSQYDPQTAVIKRVLAANLVLEDA